MPALLALLLSPAFATLPLPTFPSCGALDREDLCPSDLGDKWYLLSYVPDWSRDSVRPAELSLGSGIGADRAWRVTTGRFDVLLAFGDTGISWQDTNIVNKVYVNIGELPLPQDSRGREASSYDYDGNGLVNVADWVDDPRVDWDAGRDRADGMLDPSDLIYTFSDGVDDDGNGYIDDISGWDFFGRDNDPWNDTTDRYGDHGTGVMEEAAAEGGDGGDIGVCPNCAILPVRIADEIISDGLRVGEAIAFATDSGAVAISLATGALSNPYEAQAAVRYALDSGMSIVAVAGDENAYHHNYPATLDGALYLHSIRYDTVDSGSAAYSYMNTWNCNNYGMRMTAVASSSACATGSAAVTTGVVGLIQSAARDAGVVLSSGEVTQLLTTTVDDVYLTEEERSKSGAYPSEPGWDGFYGYGRVNAARAVEAVISGEIPPVPRLDSPSWFDWINGDITDTVTIEGGLSADRADGYTWGLAVGVGWDPDTWFQIARGQGADAFNGTLATLDLDSLPDEVWDAVPEPARTEGIMERLERVYHPAVTLRLSIEDSAGLRGEDRKTFFVQRDSGVVDGFPLDLGESMEASPTLADLDGDGVFEVIVVTTGGSVYALDGHGEPLPGWPVDLGEQDDYHPGADGVTQGYMPETLSDGTIGAPAVGDLDGDGTNEVVIGTGRGALYVIEADGSIRDGFPVWTIGREPEEFADLKKWDQGIGNAAALYDLDGDGALEIIVGALDQRLYVWSADGEDWGPYPIEVCYPEDCDDVGVRIVASPTVGDVDGDGDGDIAIGTNEAVEGGGSAVSYLLDGPSGTLLDGWPVTVRGTIGEVALLPLIGEGHPASLAMADLDGDGTLELANPVMLGQGDILHHDGTTAVDLGFGSSSFGAGSNADVSAILQAMSSPAFGDMDGDGTPDLVLGGAAIDYLLTITMTSWQDHQNAVAAWSGATGEMLPGWPRQVEDLQFLLAPAIADLDGDGDNDAVYGSAGYMLYAWDAAGELAEGWPKFVGQWVMGSPAIGDIDGDGYLEVLVTTREGYLFAWNTRGRADRASSWMSFRHDAQNTGNFETPLPVQAGPSVEAATGCCAGDGASKAWMVAPALLALSWSRRRRARGL